MSPLVFCLCFICLGPPSSLACASWFWSSCYIHNAKDLEKNKQTKQKNNELCIGGNKSIAKFENGDVFIKKYGGIYC